MSSVRKVALVKSGEETPGEKGGEAISFGLDYQRASDNFNQERSRREPIDSWQDPGDPAKPWLKYDVLLYRW